MAEFNKSNLNDKSVMIGNYYNKQEKWIRNYKQNGCVIAFFKQRHFIGCLPLGLFSHFNN